VSGLHARELLGHLLAEGRVGQITGRSQRRDQQQQQD
jgi:hypothetical protein